MNTSTKNPKLEDIGFYTLDDHRAMNASTTSNLWRCELLLTDTCNFECPYCRGMEEPDKGHISWEKAKFIIQGWAAHGLQNVRFSGGEPTLWKGGDGKNILDIVALAKELGIKRIALSTNGSVSTAFYDQLVEAGVNDFSISLDACCAEVGDEMAGGKKGAWNKVAKNIEHLSKKTYVTVGVVFTERNVPQFIDVVSFANSIGVDDIRVLSSAQWNESFRDIKIAPTILDQHPILKYRMANYNSGRHVRGLRTKDTQYCPLAMDDMAILNSKHYPCIIALREHSPPIGQIDYSLSPFEAIKKVRQERYDWMLGHNAHKDIVCANNCLDVCVDYNNKVIETNNAFEKFKNNDEHKIKKIIPIKIQS